MQRVFIAGSGRWRHPKGWSEAKAQLPGKFGWVGGRRRQEHAWQERAFPGMNTAERVTERV